jgi:hypothetical protein
MKDDNQKKFTTPLGINFRIFSLRLCQSFYGVKQTPQLELCVPLS